MGAALSVQPVAVDTFLVLVPYRPMSEIRGELDRVRDARRDAQAEREAGEGVLAGLRQLA